MMIMTGKGNESKSKSVSIFSGLFASITVWILDTEWNTHTSPREINAYMYI